MIHDTICRMVSWDEGIYDTENMCIFHPLYAIMMQGILLYILPASIGTDIGCPLLSNSQGQRAGSLSVLVSTLFLTRSHRYVPLKRSSTRKLEYGASGVIILLRII